MGQKGTQAWADWLKVALVPLPHAMSAPLEGQQTESLTAPASQDPQRNQNWQEQNYLEDHSGPDTDECQPATIPAEANK